ncbi:MAG TPA: hypothetical protein VFO39_08700 [Candidatus Sulfotelmatobacter sp.]|nr:hypothetical protein [Candidatus Sulfotelmatobacter sp.]
MSTRSSIWFGENRGNSVHIYWELAERELRDGKMTGAPVYIAADNGEKEIAVRLPKEIAMQLILILSRNFVEEVTQII